VDCAEGVVSGGDASLFCTAIDGDRVADYTIVAPTEWNFHAEGVLKAGLPDLAAPTAAALRGKIERCVLALDPCVACEIVIED
jgi:coenzyme F420-reducing hydrogenase alpha subunit